MAKKKIEPVEETIVENISLEPLEEVMDTRFAIYAKDVIQDRAIPDVRDGLKPVQRRIIFSMYKSNNVFNKPTKKCAHTVGAVMGTFHPHGDSSIYEALARMSQDWKLRYPLISFQGNNGSIDGDSPAAYRYTESRLSELSNELIKDIDKQTVDMQLNFDDTEFEPTVLPSRFPNLLANGSEGIAVGISTNIPPHNLREIIDAIIYRIGHKAATIEDLLQFVQGPDFPCGGLIYRTDSMKSIYTTGHGKVDILAKTEIVHNKDNLQIVITEIPYGVVKIALVGEIDRIIRSKSVDGMLEVRDESDWQGIRVVIDCKKDAKADLLIKYLLQKTTLQASFSANMVAIYNGHPKTFNLLDYVDAYIEHQVDVITRKSRFDLNKFISRLHIVDGLILATLNINEVVDIIKKSNDKADSKVNLMARFGLSNEQAEAIVTMPLHKLSHSDVIVLENEKKQLDADIAYLKSILEDPSKLNRVLVKELKAISDKYGDDRRSQIIEKVEDVQVDKRDLIAKEEVVIAVTKDGYIKRSTIKSYRGSGESAPGMKEGDLVISKGNAFTTDYLICFTNLGNYFAIPVHKIGETKWKDDGIHLNTFSTLGSGEKVLKAIVISDFRNDLYLAILTKFGQIKRMAFSSIEINKFIRATKYMRLLNGDEIVGVVTLTGNSDLLVITSNGTASRFNENELSILGSKAGGVKSISGLGKTNAAALLSFDEDEYKKMVLITDKGHARIIDTNKFAPTARLAKPTLIYNCFKSESHQVVNVIKINTKDELTKLILKLSDLSTFEYSFSDYYLTDADKYAKKNIDIPAKTEILDVYDTTLETINKKSVSHPILVKEDEIMEGEESSTNEETEEPISEPIIEDNKEVEAVESEEPSVIEESNEEPSVETIELLDLGDEGEEEQEKVKPQKSQKPKERKEENFEQISIFDDLDD